MPGYSDQKGPISQPTADSFAQGLQGPDRFQQLMDLLGMGGQQAPQPQPVPQQPEPQQGLNLDAAKEAAFRRALMGK